VSISASDKRQNGQQSDEIVWRILSKLQKLDMHRRLLQMLQAKPTGRPAQKSNDARNNLAALHRRCWWVSMHFSSAHANIQLQFPSKHCVRIVNANNENLMSFHNNFHFAKRISPKQEEENVCTKLVRHENVNSESFKHSSTLVKMHEQWIVNGDHVDRCDISEENQRVMTGWGAWLGSWVVDRGKRDWVSED
jgi:hypothetical protein